MDCSVNDDEEGEDTVKDVQGDTRASCSTAAVDLFREPHAAGAFSILADRSFPEAPIPAKSSPDNMAGASLNGRAAAAFVPLTPSVQGPSRAVVAEVRTCSLPCRVCPRSSPACLSTAADPA